MSEPFSIDDYRNAPGNGGPLAFDWKDKPHRVLWNLCEKAESLQRQLAEMTEDRNLWKEAHDEDCPNLLLLQAAQKQLADSERSVERERHLVANRNAVAQGLADRLEEAERKLAEVRMQRNFLDDRIQGVEMERDKAQAQNERMREALRTALSAMEPEIGTVSPQLDDAIVLARAALNPPAATAEAPDAG